MFKLTKYTVQANSSDFRDLTCFRVQRAYLLAENANVGVRLEASPISADVLQNSDTLGRICEEIRVVA